MTPEEAGPLTSHGWYLIAANGDVAARIHSGMQLGEDASGDLSFKSSDALLDLGIDDDSLVLRMLSDKHEFEVEGRHRMPAVKVRPQTRTEIRLLHNTFSIDTNFVLSGRASDTLRVEVVQVPVLKLAVGRFRSALGPRNAEPHLPDPIRAARGATQTIDPYLSEIQDGSAQDRQPEVFDTGTLLLEALPEPGMADPDDRHIQLPRNQPGAYRPARGVPVLTRLRRLPTSSAAVFGVITAITLGVIYFAFQLLAGRIYGPPALGPANPPAVSSTPSAGFQQTANVELLAAVSALLESEQLPERAAIDLALQSLKSLRVTYPNDTGVRESLEQLTVRLASEAKLSYDRGDAIMAGRLVELASNTGVAQDHVRSAITYFESTASVAVVTEPRSAPGIHPEVEVLLGTGEDILEDSVDASVGIPVGDKPSPDVEPVAIPAPSIEPRVLVAKAETSPPAEAADAEPPLQADEPSSAAEAAVAVPLPPIDPEVVINQQTPEFDVDTEAINQHLEMVRGLMLSNPPTREAVVDDAPSPGDTAATSSSDLQEAAGESPAESIGSAALTDLYPFAELTAIRLEPPEYPRKALEGAEGSVDLEFTVDESGDVRDVEVLGDPPAYFLRAARQAVSNWKFQPVLENGRPTTVRTLIRVTFRS